MCHTYRHVTYISSQIKSRERCDKRESESPVCKQFDDGSQKHNLNFVCVNLRVFFSLYFYVRQKKDCEIANMDSQRNYLLVNTEFPCPIVYVPLLCIHLKVVLLLKDELKLDRG